MNKIKSMTGYGKGIREIENKKIIVEIRSLNNKGLDLSLKIPQIYRQAEMDIRTKVTKSLIRGKVDLYVGYETSNTSSSTPINEEIFESYYMQLSKLGDKLGIDKSSGELYSTILKLPEVMQNPKPQVSEEEIKALYEAIDEALADFTSFREQEGAAMISDILHRIDLIEQYKEEIIPFESQRVESVKSRLLENLESLNIAINKERFEQELIYYIEKFDITEEKVRLQNHLNYFREVCETDPAPGKKLGFISQEIGREINTTGSKANHTEIQKIVIKMKDELEKIKEQTLNIL